MLRLLSGAKNGLHTMATVKSISRHYRLSRYNLTVMATQVRISDTTEKITARFENEMFNCR
jgi:hypothetical protein